MRNSRRWLIGIGRGLRPTAGRRTKLRSDSWRVSTTKSQILQRRAYGMRDVEYLRLKILTCMLPAIGGSPAPFILKSSTRFQEEPLSDGTVISQTIDCLSTFIFNHFVERTKVGLHVPLGAKNEIIFSRNKSCVSSSRIASKFPEIDPVIYAV